MKDVYGADAQVIGTATLIMGVAMIVGTFAYGPLDRLLRTRKWVVLGGNAVAMLACAALALWPTSGFAASVVLFATVGMFGLSFPLIMAHGRSFVPAHLVGRGVTLMNLFSIGGVGVFQVVTGRLHAASIAAGGTGAAPYQLLFAFFAGILLIGLLPYLFSRDSLD
jgi:predicted MFS family arabinose efflux permease